MPSVLVFSFLSPMNLDDFCSNFKCMECDAKYEGKASTIENLNPDYRVSCLCVLSIVCASFFVVLNVLTFIFLFVSD